MSFFKSAVRILSRTCVFFTAITLIFCVFADSFISNTLALDIKNVFLILLFSFVLSLSCLIFKIKKLPLILRILMHYVVVTLFLILGFMKKGQGTSTFRGAIVIAAALFVIYGIITAISYIILLNVKKAESDSEEYTPQFSVPSDAKEHKRAK